MNKDCVFILVTDSVYRSQLTLNTPTVFQQGWTFIYEHDQAFEMSLYTVKLKSAIWFVPPRLATGASCEWEVSNIYMGQRGRGGRKKKETQNKLNPWRLG